MHFKQLTILSLPLHIFLEQFFYSGSFFTSCNAVDVIPKAFLDVIFSIHMLFFLRAFAVKK